MDVCVSHKISARKEVKRPFSVDLLLQTYYTLRNGYRSKRLASLYSTWYHYNTLYICTLSLSLKWKGRISKLKNDARKTNIGCNDDRRNTISMSVFYNNFSIWFPPPPLYMSFDGKKKKKNCLHFVGSVCCACVCDSQRQKTGTPMACITR